MNGLIWVWYMVSVVTLFYVMYQVNLGKNMTKREQVFFFLGLYIMGVPIIHLISQSN